MFKNILIKNSFFNLAGYVIPSVIAIPALGLLARKLGLELFGVFTLAMALIGYASVFDFGLTRAIIREIAIYRNDEKEKNRIISTSTVFILVTAIIISIIIYANVERIIELISVSDKNKLDVEMSIKLITMSLPFFLLNQLWISILEGEEKFATLNIQKTISNTFLAGFPALMIFIKVNLFYAVMGLVIARVISLVISFICIRKDIVSAGLDFHFDCFKRLLLFGGWMTVSNLISPMMVYFDRFIISHLMGAKNVGYYTAPAEIISRMSILPTSISRTLFPRLSSLSDAKEFFKELKISYIIMLAVCLPLIILLMILSNQIMFYWLGSEYYLQSSMIFKVLLLGFFFNALAQIPFASIQALGFSKITALLHCAEVLPYLMLLYYLTNQFGLLGAAYAWSIRVVIDCFCLFLFAKLLTKKRLCM
ncbi:flippase [Leclercia sp. G3L]|uniref:flippase n=1 Tax=Leclercia sp. G3L TaxID=2898725 RepID=UPI001E3A0BC6|nr:flippase [Leclercia sp. G3L]UGB01004.1 flippase [Leclercia sp. G3L]